MKDEDAGHIGTASSGLAISRENGSPTMLVLSRKNRESVVAGCSNGVERLLRIMVLAFHDATVSPGFEAGDGFPVHRWEVWERIRAGGRPEAG